MSAGKWKCPSCGIGNFPAHSATGPKSLEKCKSRAARMYSAPCEGLCCNCRDDVSCGERHGYSEDDPCDTAKCEHCHWEGTMPQPKGEK